MADSPTPRDDSAQHPNPVAAPGGGQAQAQSDPSVPPSTDTVQVHGTTSSAATQAALHHGINGGIQDNSEDDHQGGAQRRLGDDRHGNAAAAGAQASLAGHQVAAAESLGVVVDDQLAVDPSGLPGNSRLPQGHSNPIAEGPPADAALLKAFKHLFLSSGDTTGHAKTSAMTKEQMIPPRKDLDKSHQLSDDKCFASLADHFEWQHKYLSRKQWSNAVEQWALAQTVPGSNACHSINTSLASGLRAQHPETKNYFTSLEDYKTFVLGLFFHDKDALVVLEKTMKRTYLSPNGQESPFNVKTLVAFANRYKSFMAYAPDDLKYSDRLMIAKIRVNLPAATQAKLDLYELNNQCMITTFPVFLRCLAAEDQAYSQDHRISQAKRITGSPTTPKPQVKRQRDPAVTSFNQLQCDARQGSRKKADQRPRCPHCSKQGHTRDQCWVLYPEKKRDFNKFKTAAVDSTAALQSMMESISAKLDSSLAQKTS